MSKYVDVLRDMAQAEDGIQAAWQKRVEPRKRSIAGVAMRKYLVNNFAIRAPSGIPTFDFKKFKHLIPKDKAADIHAFFFKPKCANEYYFEE